MFLLNFSCLPYWLFTKLLSIIYTLEWMRLGWFLESIDWYRKVTRDGMQRKHGICRLSRELGLLYSWIFRFSFFYPWFPTLDTMFPAFIYLDFLRFLIVEIWGGKCCLFIGCWLHFHSSVTFCVFLARGARSLRTIFLKLSCQMACRYVLQMEGMGRILGRREEEDIFYASGNVTEVVVVVGKSRLLASFPGSHAPSCLIYSAPVAFALVAAMFNLDNVRLLTFYRTLDVIPTAPMVGSPEASAVWRLWTLIVSLCSSRLGDGSTFLQWLTFG